MKSDEERVNKLKSVLIIGIPLVIVLAALPLFVRDFIGFMRPEGEPTPVVVVAATATASLPPVPEVAAATAIQASATDTTAAPQQAPVATNAPPTAQTFEEVLAETPALTPTPIVVTPIPPAPDVFAAATRAVIATEQALREGTPTATPPNMITATYTPKPVVVTRTATPVSEATAAFRALQATAFAATTGTPTPFPTWVLIATETPTPLPTYTLTPRPTATNTPTRTPVPLLVRITPQSPPGPTATPPGVMPATLAGKILFFSDRTRAIQLYALDPANGAIYAVTQDWPYKLALSREGRSPDGKFTAEVQMVTEVTAWDENRDTWSQTQSRAQVFVRDNEYNRTRQLTSTDKWSYDPVWSPAGNRIAFVSAQPGNDEIFSTNPDGSDLQRLTNNSWEWDKHPSWSPDGSQIVFWSNRGEGLRQLWVMNADGSDQRKLLDSPSNDWDPVWVK